MSPLISLPQNINVNILRNYIITRHEIWMTSIFSRKVELRLDSNMLSLMKLQCSGCYRSKVGVLSEQQKCQSAGTALTRETASSWTWVMWVSNEESDIIEISEMTLFALCIFIGDLPVVWFKEQPLWEAKSYAACKGHSWQRTQWTRSRVRVWWRGWTRKDVGGKKEKESTSKSSKKYTKIWSISLMAGSWRKTRPAWRSVWWYQGWCVQ